MQVNYTDLMYEAENQGLAPEDIAGDYHEVFAKWAGFKSVQDMMMWNLYIEFHGCDGPYHCDDYDVIHYPYEPKAPTEFKWDALIERALEPDPQYLSF